MRGARLVAVLIGVQAALVGGYLAVDASREPAPPFRFEVLDEAAPSLSPTRAGGAAAVPAGPHLVHFWATWCGPCLVELPGLIEAAEREGVPLLAVTDEPWPVIERFFDGDVPDAVVRDPSGAERWRVSGLPDTFAVRDGRIVARMGGPRAWGTDEAAAFLREMR